MENSSEWTIQDDLKLVELLEQFGFGNWTDVAQRLPGRTAKDCESRYLKRFVEDGVFSGLFTSCNPSCSSDYSLRIAPYPRGYSYDDFASLLDRELYLRQLEASELKLNKGESGASFRQANEAKLQTYQRKGKTFPGPVAAGYNPIRSEFDVEIDDLAEIVLAQLCENKDSDLFPNREDNELFENLQVTVGQIYNFRLAERAAKKRTVRDHALIDLRKNYSMLQRCGDILFGTRKLTVLLKFMKLLTGPELDFFVERLNYQNELRSKMNNLLSYRSLGIKHLSGVRIYESLKKKRLKYMNELAQDSFCIADELGGAGGRSMKRPTAPLVITNMPGYNLLNEDEKELCSTVRIVPHTYYKLKQLLVSECSKQNGLRLAVARQLMKMDVNKIRKVYDYLTEQNLIWLPKV